MTLTPKETELLKDMQSQEMLCVEKYKRYSQEARSCELRMLFSDLSAKEQKHLDTVNTMLAGNVPSAPAGPLQADDTHCCTYNYQSETDRKTDAFYCQDALAMEKHVSNVYDISVFEFGNPDARRMLNHIQSEEQQHGQQLYCYMKQNQMYS